MSRKRIVVIDDDPRVFQSLRMFLSEYQLTYFPDGETALESITDLSGVDMILSDFKMIGMSGLEILKKIRKINPEIPIIIMTAFGTKEIISQVLNHGANGFVEKPFYIGDVKNRIQKVLKEK